MLVSVVQESESEYVYIYPLPLEGVYAPSLPPPSHPSKSSETSKLRSLCYMTSSHQPSVLHMVAYISSPFSIPSLLCSVLPANMITVSAKSFVVIDAAMKEPCPKGNVEAFLITLGRFCPFWKEGKGHSKWQVFPKEKHSLEICLGSVFILKKLGDLGLPCCVQPSFMDTFW